jgi:hypothetical protein
MEKSSGNSLSVTRIGLDLGYGVTGVTATHA